MTAENKVTDLIAALTESVEKAKAERRRMTADRCPGSGQPPTVVGDPPSWHCAECAQGVACEWNEAICRYIAKEHAR